MEQCRGVHKLTDFSASKSVPFLPLLANFRGAIGASSAHGLSTAAMLFLLLEAALTVAVMMPPLRPSPQAPPMPPRRLPPPPSPPPPSPPVPPPVWCGDNLDYSEEGYACGDWVGETCGGARESYGMSSTFDINRLLLNCPKACLDGFPVCLPPPPSPSPPAPPLLPPPPPSPAAPPYPYERCTDNVGYSDAGWSCADWAGMECRGAHSLGVDVGLLLYSCPAACADVETVCFPPNPPTPAPPISPPPPSPPPDLQWCIGYAFRHKVIDSVIAALQHGQSAKDHSAQCHLRD